jgi:hypothetical protein
MVGNRAVGNLANAVQEHGGGSLVQRLYYAPGTRTLHVPSRFAATKVHWDKDNKVKWNRALDKVKKSKANGDEVEVTTVDKTFAEIYGDHKATMTGFLGRGLGGLQVGEMKTHDKPGELIRGLIGSGADDKTATGKALGMGFEALNKFINASDNNKEYFSAGDVAEDLELGLNPVDYVPELPDLPAAGTSVATFWPKTCTLIALVKTEGEDAAYRKASVVAPDSDTYKKAVQALHDYYMGAHIEYDDESSRLQVMKDWGYTNIFTGPSSYAELPGQVDLATGDYIFDIAGHTVKVTVKQAINAQTKVGKVSDYIRIRIRLRQRR